MESIYLLIPVSFLLVGAAVAAFVWSVGNDQFDDLDKAAHSILFEEDQPGNAIPSRDGEPDG